MLAPSSPASILRLSRTLALLCLLLACLQPLVPVIVWMISDQASLLTDNPDWVSPGVSLDVWQRAGTGLTFAAADAILSWGLWNARTCFLEFSRGVYFSVAIMAGLRRLAASLVWWILSPLLTTPISSLIVSAANPPGERLFSIGVGMTSQGTMVIILAGILWIIAAVIERARGMAEENASFV